MIYCDVYRSSKKSEMYLYIAREIQSQRLDHWQELLSADLLAAFGQATWVMDLALHPQRKLARVNIRDVLHHLQQKKYFLQLPPDGLISLTQPAPEGLRGA